jgi:hypothetical protein
MAIKWRVGNALKVLRKQMDEYAPNRSIAGDGTIGDANHASRSSDHNPWIKGRDGVYVVSAIDITNDPDDGVVARAIAEELIASRDQRIKYIISNAQIISGYKGKSPWVWRKYIGKNSHYHHFHLSVESEPEFYDSNAPWKFSGAKIKEAVKAVTPEEKAISKVVKLPVLAKGNKGADVKKLQTLLGIEADGDFGPKTHAAVRAFQTKHKMDVDGVVGPYTWEKLGAGQKV